MLFRSIRTLALTGKLGKMKGWLQSLRTYPLEITVDHSLAMDVDEPSSDVRQLDKSSEYQLTHGEGEISYERPTRSKRFTSGCAFTKSLMFPLAIQSDTIAK